MLDIRLVEALCYSMKDIPYVFSQKGRKINKFFSIEYNERYHIPTDIMMNSIFAVQTEQDNLKTIYSILVENIKELYHKEKVFFSMMYVGERDKSEIKATLDLDEYGYRLYKRRILNKIKNAFLKYGYNDENLVTLFNDEAIMISAFCKVKRENVCGEDT